MTDAELEALAERIAAKLRDEHVIPAILPAYIGQAISDAAGHGGILWVHTIPLKGPLNMATRWHLSPDGAAALELTDWTGQTIWRGTFRPAAEQAQP